MNILPKKRWHVRTKDNIARVRRDEAEAAEQERKRIEKLEYAESEARLNLLRNKAGSTARPTEQTVTPETITSSDGHVDLFSDFQSHVKTVNKEHEKEKKEEKEKYEKQIGYLTYLGQDTNEALKLRSWYEVAPNRAEVGEREIVEKDLKTKYLNDPLTLIKSLLPEEKNVNKVTKVKTAPAPQIERKEIVEELKHKTKKPKKEKKHKKDKKKSKTRDKEKKKEKYLRDEEKRMEELARKKELIDKLRRERLKREARERARQEELLCPKVEKPKAVEEVRGHPRIVQKYNSQFNPELAKQNMA